MKDFDSELPGRDIWKEVARDGKRPAQGKIFHLFKRTQAAASFLLIASVVTVFLLLEKRPSQTDPSKATAPVEQTVGNKQPVYEEEIDQINKVVEAKQAKLEEIKKTNPVLYKKFSASLDQLNDAYRDLEKELTTNPNKEELLEAMIQNLSLQLELLNQQLSIYQKIKQNKNEKVSKNI
jgi:septal ring factor EnvC (AmiA/AmiB activator)